ncbi:guanine nucleotide-binding protein alpha-4 subunit [Lentinula detonsa]|uniref:Guanine nucleotide-binding protein alpha-4 subunit n=1 Tax=Lentinula detonsa TaxID=2804962 RepID=A0A9W8P6T3_9AGAR|nr:guanine nucleotide-binding protein alpha-4 subunit [Lentinula detonsa]
MAGSSPASVTTSSDDPFDEFLKPPLGETFEERVKRLAREEEALKISMAIDASIKAERQARKKMRIVRLLLLGQSESGKSVTLRQFQRLYTPTAFREERVLWRAVIQLIIVRSVRIILDALNRPSSPSISPSTSPKSQTRSLSTTHNRRRTSQFGSSSEASSPDDYLTSLGANDHRNDPSDTETDTEDHITKSCLDTNEIDAIKLRLLPLRHIEALLIAKLVPPNEEEATRLAAPSESKNTQTPSRSSYKAQEIFVRPSPGLKGGLARARVYYPSFAGSHHSEENASSSTGRPSSAGNTGLETSDEPQEVLHACRTDVMRLWADRGVKELLHRRKIRLEEFPGFFLNDLERVTSLKYIPSDDDVLKARLKTVGVSEYHFQMEVSTGRETGTDWRIVDVGGSRSQVHLGAHYLNLRLIFLAPISGFDQVLTEDRTVNRLEDSVLLWKTVCSNKLLANVDLVLFLNKCDILEAKLKAGVRLAKYVKSFGDRANNLETVSKYLRSKFSAIHREYSPNPRKFYAFCTSVTAFRHACLNHALPSKFLFSVRDMVIRQHLKQSKLM